MTQEEKDLLLKDLSARLPYGVIAHALEINKVGTVTDVNVSYNTINLTVDNANGDYELVPISDIKPYLRPLSSMTEEEFQELHSICPHSSFNKTNVPGWIIGISGSDYGRISRIDEISKLIDWLNKKMFDYRKDDEGKTMIEKGLALEAPEGMYK